ncbi:MAG: hypothetical protein Q7U15_05895 [Methylotenera sp.]|nr:hypothetical protein [Methylotenera sp.]
MNVLLWLLYFIPALAIELMCYLLNPLVAIFTRKELRTDRAKILGGVVTMPRDYLLKPLMYFQSHDNAVDEWWYDGYAKDSHFKWLREATQDEYDASWWLRYVCRVMWLYRNNAYGFLFYWFGTPIEPLIKTYEYGVEEQGLWLRYESYPSSFKFECQIPISFTNRYFSANIGWKAHRSAPLPRKLYANRIVGLRKY